MKQKNVAESRTTMYGPDDIVRVRDGIQAGLIAARMRPADETDAYDPIELDIHGFSGNDYQEDLT